MDIGNRNGITLAIIGYVFFFFCMDGWGADWKFIKKNGEGNVLEIDVARISRQPYNIVRAWVKMIHSKESVTDWVKHMGKNTRSFLMPYIQRNITAQKKKAYIKPDSLFFGWWDNIFRELPWRMEFFNRWFTRGCRI